MNNQNLEKFRQEKNRFFRIGSESPLTDEQRKGFAGLRYFPEKPELNLEIPLDKNVDGETLIQMQTSTDATEPYRRYGYLKFKVNEKDAKLTVFENEEGELFLPFRDLTAGVETYDSGRYVEVGETTDGKLKVDFNYAYNPYCAYSEHWRCPLTPVENKLSLRVEAGEKKFHE